MNGDASLSLPENLRRQFDHFERRLWRMDTVVAFSGSACALLLSWALQFLSDRVWDTPAWLRMVFTSAGIAGFVCFTIVYGRRWIWGQPTFENLAALVQKQHRRLGDRLLGIVELADEKKRPANISPTLCAAAINQVATEAAQVDFRQAVGTKRPRKYLSGFLVVAAVAIAFFVIAPQAGWNALLRWIRPASDYVARYTFITLENVPDHLVVAHGEPFEIAVGLQARSFWKPQRISAQFEHQPSITAPVQHGSAVLKLPGQTKSGVLTLRAGDVKRQLTVESVFRPELKQLSARIELPPYLQHPPITQKIEGGALTFLEGSRVAFEGQTTRALESASVETKEHSPLKISGDSFASAPLSLDAVKECVFTWKDNVGLDCAAPVKVRLQTKPDAPPQVECRGLAAAVAILEEETVHVEIAAQDDFGVREVGVHWEATPHASTEKNPAPNEEQKKISDGAPQTKTLGGKFDFSPAQLGIPAETSVAFCATATDYFPDRKASQSAVYQIYVLSRESHARLIQEQLEKILAQLEELARRQESLLEAGKNVREQNPEKLGDDASAKKIGDQSAEQNDTAEQLERLAKQTAETLREALRNKDLSTATLQDWMKHAAAMQEIAQTQMPAAAQSLTSAQNDASSRAPKLDQALTQEQKILDAMREMQKGADASLEKLMAQNLAMRLRKIAAVEKEVAENFKKILPETVSLSAEQLPSEPQKTVQDMSALHETSRRESTKLHDEIARFFERTKLDRYGDVARDMDAVKTDDGLLKLAQLIEKNVSVSAIQSASDWSGKFENWAKRLGEQDDSQSQANGKNPSEADMKALLALLRLRQHEDELRDRTTTLDAQKQTNSRYADEARKAASRQHELRETVEDFLDDLKFPVPPNQLQPVSNAMHDAKDFLDKPDTGDPAVNAETDAINLLDAIIMSQCQKQGQSMAALMQMMGVGAGAKPGGSLAGGSTERANIHVSGTRVGGSPDARTVIQASGANSDAGQIPAEFRDAVESYQRALEHGATTE